MSDCHLISQSLILQSEGDAASKPLCPYAVHILGMVFDNLQASCYTNL